MKRKYGFYHYNKSKGMIPLDKSNSPLFKSKKAYQEFIDKTLLPEMGLSNKKEKWWAKSSKRVPDLVQFVDGEEITLTTKVIDNYIPVEVNSGYQSWKMNHYIYLDCDLTKISIHTLLNDFKVKKNSNAFVIKYRNFNQNITSGKTVSGKPTNRVILALPIIEGYSLLNLKSTIIPKYKGTVRFCWEIPNIFSTTVEIRTLPDNKLLQFYELYDYFHNRKEVDLYNCIKGSQSIFKRNYKKTDNWIETKNGTKIRPEWIMKEYTCDKDVIDLSLKVFPVLINQYQDYLKGSTGYSELDVVYRNKAIETLSNVFKNDICQFDKKYFTDDLRKKLFRTFTYCCNNRKELCVNQKFISNQNILSQKEKLFLKMFYIPKLINEFKSQYKRQDCQKQFEFMLEQFVLEVFSQMKYDELNNNKDYKGKNSLELDEHIKHTTISDKWFNLFIANLKDNYKGFNIKPNSNIKYKLLRALDLSLNEEFIKGLYCKSIISSVKNVLTFIKDKVETYTQILSNNRLDNIIILYVKIISVLILLKQKIDELISDYDKKLQESLAPPEEKTIESWSSSEEFWNQYLLS